MSSANPVIVAGPNANLLPAIVIPNANPVAKASLSARAKAVAESIWSVVKPILIILAIAVGAAAGAALLGYVTFALSPLILMIAAAVGAVALAYRLYKLIQRATQANNTPGVAKFRKKLP